MKRDTRGLISDLGASFPLFFPYFILMASTRSNTNKWNVGHLAGGTTDIVQQSGHEDRIWKWTLTPEAIAQCFIRDVFRMVPNDTEGAHNFWR